MREDERWQRVRATMEQHRQQVWRDEQLPVPGNWQIITEGNTTSLRSLQLRMPNCRYGTSSYTCSKQCSKVHTQHGMFEVSILSYVAMLVTVGLLETW